MATVLVIDDDENIREVLRVLLEARGLGVAVAADGHEGLHLLRAGPLPALVLLDLMMPNLDGTAVLREIEADPQLRRVPVVVLSGDPRACVKAQQLGAAECLRKPVELPDLMSVVQRFAIGNAHPSPR